MPIQRSDSQRWITTMRLMSMLARAGSSPVPALAHQLAARGGDDPLEALPQPTTAFGHRPAKAAGKCPEDGCTRCDECHYVGQCG